MSNLNDFNREAKAALWVVLQWLLLAVPTAICVRYDAWPPITWVLRGLLGVAPIYWTIGTIEVLTYVPMLGTGGSYLGFFTGNLTSLKVPCALNAMEAADVEPGTEAGEVISTIAIAVSALVTTAVIAVGVLLLSQIRGFLESPVLQPAFDNILPALFGPLAVVYVAKNWKVASPISLARIVSSGRPIVMATAVFLMRFIASLVSGGSTRRKAIGRMTKR